MAATAATLMEARAVSIGQLVCGSDTLCSRSCTTLLPSTAQQAAPVVSHSDNDTAVLSHSHQAFDTLCCTFQNTVTLHASTLHAQYAC